MRNIIWIIIAVIVLGGLWYFVGPLVRTSEVDEEFPTTEELAEMTEEEKEEIEETMMEHAATMPPTIIEESMPADVSGPELLRSGMFVGADSFHRGSGDAGIYALENDERVLRFEDFSVTNGPDLRVLLSKSDNPDDIGQYIELGKLKGNQGNQNYDIPSDVDTSEYKSVFIYCKPFHVIFSVAQLIE